MYKRILWITTTNWLVIFWTKDSEEAVWIILIITEFQLIGRKVHQTLNFRIQKTLDEILIEFELLKCWKVLLLANALRFSKRDCKRRPLRQLLPGQKYCHVLHAPPEGRSNGSHILHSHGSVSKRGICHSHRYRKWSGNNSITMSKYN